MKGLLPAHKSAEIQVFVYMDYYRGNGFKNSLSPPMHTKHTC